MSEKISVNKFAEEIWDEFFSKTSPEQASKIITKDMPETTRIEVIQAIDIPQIIIKNNDRDNYFEFSYTVYKDYIKCNSANVAEQFRKHGTAKTIQRNMSLFCIENNFERIEIHSMNTGSYAWARIGFVPTVFHWNDRKQTMEEKISLFKKQIPFKERFSISNTFNQLNSAIKSENPKALWDIADNKTPFYFDQKISWGQAMLIPTSKLPQNIKSGRNFTYSGNIYVKDPDCIKRLGNG